VKWLADENFRNAIVRGLLRKAPAFDIVRAQDVREISGQDDRVLLQFATAEGRVVATHDLSRP
jgi:predicted nuclease of predicted toxin-antitoxin system